jgi:predicted transcriptional regulator
MYGAKEEKTRMNEQRASEIARREVAQAHAGQIVAGSGKRGKPRRMPRMVSARLDGELLRQLRIVAQQRNTTVSDLLREGAELIIEDAYANARPRTNFTVSGAKEWLPTAAERELAAR